MANSRKTARKAATVAQMPAPAGAVAVEDIPQEFQEPAEAAPQAASPAPPAPSRNPLKKKDPKLPQEGDFFTRVAQISREDWDSRRVFLYLYVLEPLCNLKQSGGKSYLNRYSEPIRDEHQIAEEYGSGRYRLMLAYNKVSPDESTELARHEFEIYSLKFPPKIPRAAWINDSRNGKWEALLPKEPPPATAAGSVIDAMRMVSEIRRNLKDEIEDRAPEQQPSSISETLATIKAAKDLFGTPPAAAAPAKDPLEIAVALFTLMNTQKADNPLVEMYRDELRAMRDELKEARQQAANATAPKGLVEQITELAALGDKLEPLKKMLGFGNGAAAEVAGRASKTTGYDMFRDIMQTPMMQEVGAGLGSLLANLARNGTAQNPAQPRPPIVLNQQNSNGTAPPAEDLEVRINRIGQTITQPMLYEFFLKDEPGDVFAATMFNMWPEDYAFMRQLGPENIVGRYRKFAPAWALIAPKEPAFIQFIKEFCEWDPNEDEAPAPDTGGDDGVRDLENEEGGN